MFVWQQDKNAASCLHASCIFGECGTSKGEALRCTREIRKYFPAHKEATTTIRRYKKKFSPHLARVVQRVYNDND